MKIGPTPPVVPNIFEDVKIRAHGDMGKFEGATFGQIIEKAITGVNHTITDANKLNFQLALGEIDDISEVMIAGEKAALALNLTLEIRNRVVDAYQQTLRMAT